MEKMTELQIWRSKMKNSKRLQPLRAIIFVSLMFTITLFSINLAFSLEFDNIKNPIDIVKGEDYLVGNKTIEYNYLWEKYKPVEINNFFNLGDVLFSGAIINHDDICGSNCDSILDVYLANEDVLIQDIKFFEVNGNEKIETIIEDYKIYIKTGETETSKEVNQWVCIPGKILVNGSIKQDCEYKLVTIKIYTPIWSIYNIGDKLSSGTYQIKIEGTKNFYKTIDWQIQTQGKWIEDWADWGAGGTVTYDGTFVVHTFLANGTFNVSTEGNISFLIVAGGGAGGGNTNNAGGGGGAGGILFAGNYTLSTGNYSVVVGDGGAGASGTFGGNGTNSSFAGFVAIGGGGGGESTPHGSGMDGGSGGGCNNGLTGMKGGSPLFTNYAETIEYGMFGGCSDVGGFEYGGGGGSGTNGTAGGWASSGKGGNGTAFTIYNGTLIYYSGGGGASGNNGGIGGLGGGGKGQGIASGAGENGNTNTGGGGGACATAGACTGYSGGSGIVIIRYETIVTVPIVSIISPANNTISSDVYLNINYTIINTTALSSCWYSNDTYAVNTTIQCFTNLTDITWNERRHNVTIWANNTAGEVGFNYVNFTIDSTPPNITLYNPSLIENLGQYDINQTLNWSVSDTYPGIIWWEYNGTNTTLIGSINSTSFVLHPSLYNGTLWANDSVGNIAKITRTWDYKVFVLNETYVSSTISGTTNKFLLQLETNGTQVTVGYLKYNNTNILGSITSSGNNYNLTKNQIATIVLSPTNISFFWNVTLADGYNFIRDSKNQTVSPIVINGTCGNLTYAIFNFTLADEITQAKINGTSHNSSIKVDLNLYTSDRTINLTHFYKEFSQANPAAVCIDNNLSNGEQYSVDIQVKYGAINYSSEFHHIERYVLNSSNLYNNVTLYDLDTANTQNFRLIARDTSYLPVEDALIKIERKYIENGTFYITEIPKADDDGITSASLQVNEIIYNFYIYQNGTLISSRTNVLAICQTPLVSTCEIDFNAFQTEITIPNYEEGDDFNFTLGYNSTSKVVSSQFIIPSGTPGTIRLDVIKEDALGTAICSDTLTSASGTLSCTVPATFKNATVVAKLYKNNIEQGKGNIKLDQDSSDIYGVILVIISILVLMTLIGIGISDSPIITGVFLFVGVILLAAMNLIQNTGFIGATATILFLAIAIILIIIKASKRS